MDTRQAFFRVVIPMFVALSLTHHVYATGFVSVRCKVLSVSPARIEVHGGSNDTAWTITTTHWIQTGRDLREDDVGQSFSATMLVPDMGAGYVVIREGGSFGRTKTNGIVYEGKWHHGRIEGILLVLLVTFSIFRYLFSYPVFGMWVLIATPITVLWMWRRRARSRIRSGPDIDAE